MSVPVRAEVRQCTWRRSSPGRYSRSAWKARSELVTSPGGPALEVVEEAGGARRPGARCGGGRRARARRSTSSPGARGRAGRRAPNGPGRRRSPPAGRWGSRRPPRARRRSAGPAGRRPPRRRPPAARAGPAAPVGRRCCARRRAPSARSPTTTRRAGQAQVDGVGLAAHGERQRGGEDAEQRRAERDELEPAERRPATDAATPRARTTQPAAPTQRSARPTAPRGPARAPLTPGRCAAARQDPGRAAVRARRSRRRSVGARAGPLTARWAPGTAASTAARASAAVAPSNSASASSTRRWASTGCAELLDVVGHDVAAPVRRRPRLRRAHQGEGAADRHPERHPGRAPGLLGQRRDVIEHGGLDVDRAGQAHELGDVLAGDDRLDGGRPGPARAAPARISHGGGVVGVADRGLDEEPVELGLGQAVGAGLLDRVLGGEDDERLAHRVRHAVDRDPALLHDLQQRGLGLGRGAVDLVGEDDVGEDRARGGTRRSGSAGRRSTRR